MHLPPDEMPADGVSKASEALVTEVPTSDMLEIMSDISETVSSEIAGCDVTTSEGPEKAESDLAKVAAEFGVSWVPSRPPRGPAPVQHAGCCCPGRMFAAAAAAPAAAARASSGMAASSPRRPGTAAVAAGAVSGPEDMNHLYAAVTSWIASSHAEEPLPEPAVDRTC